MSDKTKEFIKKAIKIHGDKYDYSKVDYINSHTNVTIICKEHSDFKISPNKHLSSKRGCQMCSKNHKINKSRHTTNDFIQKATQRHGDKFNYNKVEYINSQTNVIIICKTHGEFIQNPANHLTSNGCTKCSNENSGNSQRLSNEYFIKKATEKHGDKYDYNKVEYINSHTNVTIICKTHGDFLQQPNNHLNGATCLLCSNEKISEKQRMTTEEFISRSIQIHGNNYDYSKTEYGVNNYDKVIIICKKHGEFKQAPSNHLSKKGCSKCKIIKISEKQRMTTEEFISRSIQIHGNNYDYSKTEYGYNNNDKVIIICKKHGEFKQAPANHLSRTGCPFCINKTEGKIYRIIKVLYSDILCSYRIEWCKKYRKLPYDFCIPKHKIIIELDGAQHFRQVRNWKSPEEQFENDKFKEKCANENGYSIIRLLQEDVFNDKYDWKTELVNNIEKIKIDNIIQNIYMCKNNEYDDFMN